MALAGGIVGDVSGVFMGVLLRMATLFGLLYVSLFLQEIVFWLNLGANWGCAEACCNFGRFLDGGCVVVTQIGFSVQVA